ncbi:MAG: DUF2249 domain-containing protein [Bacilli bacterium]
MARKIVGLDVREILKQHGEPFDLIMKAFGELTEHDVLQLHATFEPTPLMRIQGKQGFQNVVQQEDSDHFIIQFYRQTASLPYWHIDNRGLEPPQPMIRSLEWLDGHQEVQAGTMGLEIWNERVPALLLPELEERNLRYEIADEGDMTVVVKIQQ